MPTPNGLLLGLERNRVTLRDERCYKAWPSLSPVAALRLGGNDLKQGQLIRDSTVKLEPDNGGLRGEVAWSREGQDIRIPLSMKLNEDELEVGAGPLDGLEEEDRFELEFPRGLGWAHAGSDGYLVLPIGLGVQCDFSSQRKSKQIVKNIYSGGQTGITMPLFGTVQGDQALGGILLTPYDCKLKVHINTGTKGLYALTPVWVFDQRNNSTRKALYFPLEKGDYVSIAKRYRRELVDNHRLPSLREKMDQSHELSTVPGALLGHRRLSYTDSENTDPLDTGNVYGYFRAALGAGFDRVVIHNVLRGDEDEMASAASFARSLSPGFRLSVYENYLDIFRPGEEPERPGVKKCPPWDESLIARSRDGSMRPNWRVRRRGQPDIWTYTVCPARRLEVALPQMEKLRSILGPGSIYIDVEGAVPLFDCYDKRHPVTKEEDANLRRELLVEVKRRFGVVTTESLPQDFLAHVADVGSYFSVFPYSGFGNSERRIMPPLVPIPLHTLVWHGSIMNQTGTGTTFYQSDPPHAALLGWLADTMDDKGRRISYKLRGTAMAEMVDHRFLTGPRVVVGSDNAFHCNDVQMTRFSDGTVVIANFATSPYLWQGRSIPPMDFLIFNERLYLELTIPPRSPPSGRIRISIRVKNTWDRAIRASTLSLYERRAAHSETPFYECDLPPLRPDEHVLERTSLQLKEKAGDLWIVAFIDVHDNEPWRVAELAQCHIG